MQPEKHFSLYSSADVKFELHLFSSFTHFDHCSLILQVVPVTSFRSNLQTIFKITFETMAVVNTVSIAINFVISLAYTAWSTFSRVQSAFT